jgi:HAD superfamily hydrolase (TIGR01490 family)
MSSVSMTTPRAYAFFDVDDTLISIKSLLRFQEYWYQWTGDEAGRKAYTDEIHGLLAQDAPWEFVNRRYYAHFAGRSVADVRRCVQLWFGDVEQSFNSENQLLFQPAIVRRLQQHRLDGVEPVFVSGSFELLLEPVAARLQVTHVLAIKQQVADGYFTGHIVPPQTIGQGKADALLDFLKQRNVAAENCYAYGDDISDAPMLSSVGFPFVVRGGRRLEMYAQQTGWPVIDPA